jgi:hypothetical protein
MNTVQAEYKHAVTKSANTYPVFQVRCLKNTKNTFSPLFTSTQDISIKKQTPWPESASKIYRPSDRRLLGEVSASFCG